MLISTSSNLLRRILLGGVSGAVAGFGVGYSLAARNPVPLLFALAGMAIAPGVPEPSPERADPRRRLAELAPPPDRASAWLPDPLGGEEERLLDGSERRGQRGQSGFA